MEIPYQAAAELRSARPAAAPDRCSRPPAVRLSHGLSSNEMALITSDCAFVVQCAP